MAVQVPQPMHHHRERIHNIVMEAFMELRNKIWSNSMPRNQSVIQPILFHRLFQPEVWTPRVTLLLFSLSL
jgi:hypothetical protein